MDSKAQYPCPYQEWGKILATTFSLRRHVDLKHRKQKNHICKYWGKRFSLLQYLKEHILIHTQETPFACGIDGCKESFRQRAKLWAHRKTHREDQNQSNFMSDGRFKPNKTQVILKDWNANLDLKNINEWDYCLWDLKKSNSAFTVYSRGTKNLTLPRLDFIQDLLTETPCQFKDKF